MDKARLQELRDQAEKRCTELFNQVQSLTTELERVRGEYRAFDALLLHWQETPADKPAKQPKEKV